jgi:hypothetical protein
MLAGAGVATLACMAPSAAPDARYAIRRQMPPASIKKTIDRFSDSMSRRPIDHEVEALAQVAPTASTDPLIQLLAHQTADGSFDASPLVTRVLKSVPLDHAALSKSIDDFLRDRHLPSDRRPKPAFTLRILLTLRLGFPDRQPAWKRAARKASRFLAGALNAASSQFEKWLVELEGAVRS